MNEEQISISTIKDDALKFIHKTLNEQETKRNPAMVAAITGLLDEIIRN